MTDAKALGVQTHAMWGFSPSYDLLAPSDKATNQSCSSSNSSNTEEVNDTLRVLVARPADIRHVLATISRRRRHKKVKRFQIYVIEQQLEVLARHLLLLQVCCDWELPIRQRATVFLEIFGNTLVQARTQRYIYRIGLQLIELVCNGTGPLSDFVDLSGLKYRDRDSLVDIFRSWDPVIGYDAVGLRDYRLRAHFGNRYDNRIGVIDWDYHARVKPVASIIHQKLYRDWRLTGVGFEFGDQTYDHPNRSLGSYAEGFMKKGKDKGLKKEVRGYWIDVVNSPFISFGVHCDRSTAHSDGLFEIQNKGSGVEQQRHHTVEVAMFNILSYLWEIETGEPYTMTKAHDIYSGLGDDASDAAWTADLGKGNGVKGEAEAAETWRRQQALQRAKCIVDTFSDMKISLLQGGVDGLINKAAYAKQFHVVHLSGNAAHHLNNDGITSILAHSATVLVETGKYLVPLSGEQAGLYMEKIKEMGAARGLLPTDDDAGDDGSLLAFGFAGGGG